MNRLACWWRPETGFFLILWLGLLAAGRSSLFHDPGTFWHTVVGERLISRHQLIYTDPFSFTFAGQAWIPHQWLGECLMALAHRIDGLDTLLLVAVTVLAAVYTWVGHRLLRAGMHWSLTLVFLLLLVAASSSHFHIRPHLATMVGMAVTMAFLCDFEAGRIRTGQIAWLVPVFIIWANIHGGMLGGLCTFGLAVVAWCAIGLVRRRGPVVDLRTAVLLGCIVLACGLGAFVNPYGWRLPWTWLSIMDSPLLPHIIREHAPLDFTSPYGCCMALLALLYIAALVSAMPRLRITWLLPLLWFYLASTRVRHAPLFSLVAAVAFADMLPHTRWAAYLVRSGSDWFRMPAADEPHERFSWRPMLLPACVVAVAFVTQLERCPVPVIGHGWARLDPDDWPLELLPKLREAQGLAADRESPSRPRIFNEYADGGFLIYFAPGFQVFVDDRCELYGDAWLQAYVEAESTSATPAVRSWQERYRKGNEPAFTYALARHGSTFDVYFGASKEWSIVKRTPTATLYKRDSKTAVARATSP